jgi:eukaryotic-like serine/threonine-protein kinase
MNVAPPDQFLVCIERSGLVEEVRLAEAIAEIAATDPQARSDSNMLAGHLIEQKLLTRWQADNLLQGKSSGFVLGQYKLLGLLGTGHSSSVYLGEHLMTTALRAIKVLPVSRASSAAWMARFSNGAIVGARVSHRNVAGTFDIGLHKKHHYVVIEYVDGSNLHAIVVKQARSSGESRSTLSARRPRRWRICTRSVLSIAT